MLEVYVGFFSLPFDDVCTYVTCQASKNYISRIFSSSKDLVLDKHNKYAGKCHICPLLTTLLFFCAVAEQVKEILTRYIYKQMYVQGSLY
jgi:hypothetical protein